MTDPSQTISDSPLPHLVVRRAVTADDRDACLRIRFEVFVAEQGVPPDEELDDLDDGSLHYLALDGSDAVGTARVIPKAATAKIGRVAVVKRCRGRSVGLALMRYVIADCARSGFREAVLDSQTYAVPFYEKLGFVAEGDEFLDANIPHFLMRRALAPEGDRS